MSSADNMANCASCGHDGDDLKTCNACKLVKYCNATCQRAHRPNHKKECKKRAAELKREKEEEERRTAQQKRESEIIAAKLHDEALFTQPPPNEDCSICFLPLPLLRSGSKYQLCCGKLLCIGCIHAEYTNADMKGGRHLCPFCRAPEYDTMGEELERLKIRAEGDDAKAINLLGHHYFTGECVGLPQDYTKAVKFWLRAGELGYATSYDDIAIAYCNGYGVERDMKKAKHYYELAAMGGDMASRHRFGGMELEERNVSRAAKHWLIASKAGYDDSLKGIRLLFTKGRVTKDGFEKALRAHQAAKDEMKSDQRDAAAAFAPLVMLHNKII